MAFSKNAEKSEQRESSLVCNELSVEFIEKKIFFFTNIDFRPFSITNVLKKGLFY